MTVVNKGDRVYTTHNGHLLKGKDRREGTVVGMGNDPECVWVQWDGWRGTSRVRVPMEWLEKI